MFFRFKKAFIILKEKGFLGLVPYWRKYIQYQKDLFRIPALKKEIKNLQKRNPSPDEFSNLVFHPANQIIHPQQKPQEIKNFLKIIQEKKPQRILEIGTASGGTLFLLCQSAHPQAKIISIDRPYGGFGLGGYPLWKKVIFHSFPQSHQKLYLIRKDSHDKQTKKEVEEILKDQSIDLLFIDGDHSYSGVKKDFLMYSPLVKSKGLIVFHDIVSHSQISGCEVDKFWKEILADREKCQEIVTDPQEKWGGIGILQI